jgi:radical SAM superfamily enzyme YgiQ (UPF0313 family)
LDTDELGGAYFPSFGIRRIHAAAAADPACPGHEIRIIDIEREDVAAYIDEILAFEPDILGISIYVWSTDCMVAVARGVKRRRPETLIVFGGPSARSALFDLDYYNDPGDYLDAVVEGDGEVIFRAIARLPELTRDALRGVPGAIIPTSPGWHRTPPPLGGMELDNLPSPFQLGLMPEGTVAYLETFRGCPFTCRFCEWGTRDLRRGIFSVDYLTRELRAFAEIRAPAVFLLDAGLNLNIRAFHNLRQANREVGFLKHTLFWAEIYPSAVRDEHLEFLQEIGAGYLGVGLQSSDRDVLRLHQRPTESARFEEAVRRLASVTSIELQIIFGLPGDSPDGFRRTLDYALSLPGAVRAYHCLVLPDALMTRGLPEWGMQFDPRTLAMTSCLGWERDDIAEMRQELRQRSQMMGGKWGNFWWSFPARRPAMAPAFPA